MRLKYKIIVMVFLAGLLCISGCNKKEEHIHEYEDIKTYYLSDEGNDYYTQRCISGNEIKRVEVEEKYKLNDLLFSLNNGDKVVIDRDINKDINSFTTYLIRKAITIEGGEKVPKIYGNFRIQLDDKEIRPVTIKNLEIIHNGGLQYDDHTNPMIGKDERRGIFVANGGVVLENNYIHLLNESPSDMLYNASVGIQISVSKNNEYKNEYIYSINNNRIGKYNKSQTTSSSVPMGILLDNDVNAKLDVTLEETKQIYDNNVFDEGTECYLLSYDYENNKYAAGYFSTLEIAHMYLSTN